MNRDGRDLGRDLKLGEEPVVRPLDRVEDPQPLEPRPRAIIERRLGPLASPWGARVGVHDDREGPAVRPAQQRVGHLPRHHPVPLVGILELRSVAQQLPATS